MPAEPGFHEYEQGDEKLVLHLSEQEGRRLYLLYNRGQVDTLAAYYGLVPLTLVLVVLYLSVWISYRISRRMISPVSLLARQVNEVDFNSPDFSPMKPRHLPFEVDDDVQVLSDAIVNLGKRLEAFITRERNFTRDASHELRSPLTVINIATDMLLSEQGLSESARETLQRIKRSTTDMEELIEAFLLLARESDQALSRELVSINDVIEGEIDRVRLINEQQDLTISYTAEKELKVWASERVLSVLFGNLLRNAVLYTDRGSVDVTIDEGSVVIKDSGKGISPQQVKEIFKPYYRGDNSGTVGHGVGLTIVKRLSDRFDWPITINSAPEQGTCVEVRFPRSEAEALR
jgi:signal transduction histidine kinase